MPLKHRNLRSKNVNCGDALRDDAAGWLFARFGNAKTEKRAYGKKVDIFFETVEFGKRVRHYVEAKDFERPLRRSEVVKIWADYEGIIKNNRPATLILVTRMGLSPDALKYVEAEISDLRHQTIFEIEDGSIDITNHINGILSEKERSGIETYYVEGGYSWDPKNETNIHFVNKGTTKIDERALLKKLLTWIATDNYDPVAILGGYGSGKSSLALMLAARLAEMSIDDPKTRRPILLRLGAISQFASVEGILGALFTGTHHSSNFNFQNFMKLNDMGKFVVILDGFDEMKHAMSWADFKAQFRSLLRLHGQKAKFILLGRPSAFLSNDEYNYILRGKVRYRDSWRELQDWPNFCELSITEFSKEDRKRFVEDYLKFLAEKATAKNSKDPVQFNSRAGEINEIADRDPSLFSKPVHIKILTDLAADPSVDLSVFSQGGSRWLLYSEFISSLYDRELEKDARIPISHEVRLDFLVDLAFWLWSNKQKQTSFSSEELPDELILEKISIDVSEIESAKRELLSGSILEMKANGVFFFGHRSFAEYLVAERLRTKTPKPHEHSIYASFLEDGVLSFFARCQNAGQNSGLGGNSFGCEGTH